MNSDTNLKELVFNFVKKNIDKFDFYTGISESNKDKLIFYLYFYNKNNKIFDSDAFKSTLFYFGKNEVKIFFSKIICQICINLISLRDLIQIFELNDNEIKLILININICKESCITQDAIKNINNAIDIPIEFI